MMSAHGVAHLPQDGSPHDSVHRPVAAVFYPAGGGVKITFSSFLEKLRSQLRILYRTEKYTPYAMAALSMIPSKTAKMITYTVLEIGSFKRKS
jgi:phosphonate transport system substrate-binding protein